MQTPNYPPAAAYETPLAAPYRLSVRGCSIADLMSRPDAWAIVLKYMPAAKFMTASPMAQPQLGNMTLADFALFAGAADNPAFPIIDQELGRLPQQP